MMNALLMIGMCFVVSLIYCFYRQWTNRSDSDWDIVRHPMITAGYAAIVFGLMRFPPDEESHYLIEQSMLTKNEFIKYDTVQAYWGVAGRIWLSHTLRGREGAKMEYDLLIKHNLITGSFEEVLDQQINTEPKPEFRVYAEHRYFTIQGNREELIRRQSIWERVKDMCVFGFSGLMAMLLTGHLSVNRGRFSGSSP